ncbi:hypothetical protein BDV11DRAFT_188668 [Aspergillus similis]
MFPWLCLRLSRILSDNLSLSAIDLTWLSFDETGSSRTLQFGLRRSFALLGTWQSLMLGSPCSLRDYPQIDMLCYEVAFYLGLLVEMRTFESRNRYVTDWFFPSLALKDLITEYMTQASNSARF